MTIRGMNFSVSKTVSRSGDWPIGCENASSDLRHHGLAADQFAFFNFISDHDFLVPVICVNGALRMPWPFCFIFSGD